MFPKEAAKIFIRNVGRRIAEIRIENGITQEALAAKMGVDARDLQRWETKRGMSFSTFYRFTWALNRPAADFFEKPKKQTKKQIHSSRNNDQAS